MRPGRKTQKRPRRKNRRSSRRTFRQRGGFSIGELRKILRNIQGICDGGKSFTEATVAPLHAQLRDLLAKRSSSNIDPGLSALIARLLGAASRPEEYAAILAELDRRIEELEDAEINAGVEGGVYSYQNLAKPFDHGDLRDLLIKIMKSTTSSQRALVQRMGFFELVEPCKAAVRRIPDYEKRTDLYAILLFLDQFNLASYERSIPGFINKLYISLNYFVSAGQFPSRQHEEIRQISILRLTWDSSTLGEVLRGYLSPLYHLLGQPETMTSLQRLPPSPRTNSVYETYNIIRKLNKYLGMTIYELMDNLLKLLSSYVSTKGGPAGLFPDALYYRLTDILYELTKYIRPSPESIDALGSELLRYLHKLPPQYMPVLSALRHPPHFEGLADLQGFAGEVQASLAHMSHDFRHNRNMRRAGAAAGDNLPRKRRVANAELFEAEVNLGAAPSRNNVGNLPLPPAAAAGGRGRIRRGVVEDEEELEPPAPLGVKILKEANLNGELSNFNLANNSGAAARTGP